MHLYNLYLFLLNVKNGILVSLFFRDSDSAILLGGQILCNLLNQISLTNLKVFYVSRQCI